MLYMPVNHLKPGMMLAKDLPSDKFHLALLKTGQALTHNIITKLKLCGIQGAYIESMISQDIEADELIDPRLQQEVLASLKVQFDDYAMHSFTPKLYDAMSGAASALVSNVMSKDEMLLNMIDIRDYDTYTYSHCMYVALISVLIGTQLDLNERQLNELAICGLLHDIGKLEVPIGIVNKPGKLTDDEMEEIKKHPANAVMRLQKLHCFPFAITVGIGAHHEKIDGSGYPHRLSAGEIPLYGKILAIADVYDALLSKRPYRDAWMPSQAVEYMMGLAGVHFDHDLLQKFLKVVSCYPIGTVVEMSNGFMGVVIRNTLGFALRPIVRILSPQEYRNEQIDLSNDAQYLNITIIGMIKDNTELPTNLF